MKTKQQAEAAPAGEQQADRDAAYRIIGRLQISNVRLYKTLQSATAWIRRAGGDCAGLDSVLASENENFQNNQRAQWLIDRAAIAQAEGRVA